MVTQAHILDAYPMRRDREKVAEAFGRALRQQRTRVGFSQEELAFQAQVDRTFVSRTERGERQPALTTVFMLARALGIPATTLVKQVEKNLVADPPTARQKSRK